MKVIFYDDFKVCSGNFPANWRIEKNSDMDLVATELKDGVFSLLSPGDKYLPVISPCRNAEVYFRLQIPSHVVSRYDFMITFRYDEYHRKGECLRIWADKNTRQQKIEYGEMIDNRFVTQQSLDSNLPENGFSNPLPLQLSFREQKIRLQLGESAFAFETNTPPARRADCHFPGNHVLQSRCEPVRNFFR